MPARGAKSSVEIVSRGIEEGRIGARNPGTRRDKWTLLVIDALDGEKKVRFSRLRERIGGVSQKMLTKTCVSSNVTAW